MSDKLYPNLARLNLTNFDRDLDYTGIPLEGWVHPFCLVPFVLSALVIIFVGRPNSITALWLIFNFALIHPMDLWALPQFYMQFVLSPVRKPTLSFLSLFPFLPSLLFLSPTSFPLKVGRYSGFWSQVSCWWVFYPRYTILGNLWPLCYHRVVTWGCCDDSFLFPMVCRHTTLI